MKVRGVNAAGAVRASAFELRSVFGSSPGAGNLRGAIAGAGDDLKKGSPFDIAVQDSITALAHGGGLSGVLMTLGQSLVPGLGTAMATVGGVLGSFGVDLGGLGEALKGVFHALTFGIFASENLDMFGGEVSSTEARARERLAPLIEAAIQRGAPQWEIMSNLINSWSRLFEQSGLTFTQWKVLLTSSGVPSGAAEMPESVRRGFEFLRQFRPDLYDNGIGNIWQQPTLYTDLYAGIDTSGFSGKTAFGGSAPVVQVFLDNEMVTGLIADQLVREVITKSG